MGISHLNENDVFMNVQVLKKLFYSPVLQSELAINDHFFTSFSKKSDKLDEDFNMLWDGKNDFCVIMAMKQFSPLFSHWFYFIVSLENYWFMYHTYDNFIKHKTRIKRKTVHR